MSIGHLRLFVVALLATVLALLTPSVPMASSTAQAPPAFLEQLEKGEALMAQGRHQEAIRTLRKAEKLSPVPSWQVLQNLAVCFNRVGQFERSEDYARAAVEVAETPSQKASALFMLGLSLDLSVEAEEAEAVFRQVLQITRGHANIARFRLGEVLGRQGKHEEAHAAFSEYLEREPDGELSAEARSTIDYLACWLSFEGEFAVPDRESLVPEKISGPDPQMTPAFREASTRGEVILQAIIDENGDVRGLEILEDPGMGMGQAAADAICRSKYEPSIQNGEPVAVILKSVIRFQRPRSITITDCRLPHPLCGSVVAQITVRQGNREEGYRSTLTSDGFQAIHMRKIRRMKHEVEIALRITETEGQKHCDPYTPGAAWTYSGRLEEAGRRQYSVSFTQFTASGLDHKGEGEPRAP